MLGVNDLNIFLSKEKTACFVVILEGAERPIESTGFNQAVDSIAPQPLASSWVRSRMTIGRRFF